MSEYVKTTPSFLDAMRIVVGLVLCAGLLVFVTGCGPDADKSESEVTFEVDEVYDRGPVTVHVRLDKTKITIAETVLLQFEATVQPAYEIQMPKVDEALANFGLVDWDNLGRKLDAENNVVTTYQYRLEPFLSGEYEIPAFTFTFTDVNEPEAEHELASEPIAVEVTSLLGEQRAELVLEDIDGPVTMPPEKWPWWIWLVIGGGIATAVAGVVLWIVLSRRRGGVVMRIFKSAHELAYVRLRALVAEDLVEAGRLKEFYERLSGILRYYIEDRFDLRAPERTTEEFLAELKWTDTLAADDKALLEKFLTHCDLVKFAKQTPTAEQIQETFDLVKGFIERTKSQEHVVDVTDKVEAAAPTPAEVE